MLKEHNYLIKVQKVINIPHIFCLMILTLSMVLCGCYSSSSVDEETFEEKYEAAKQKYEKYLNEPVSGQEVLNLIDNWDETDFEMTVSDLKGNDKYFVSNLDKEKTKFGYWNEESIYYIDPNAFYKGSFVLFESPGRVSHKGIGSLHFSLVEDSSPSDDNTTVNDD